MCIYISYGAHFSTIAFTWSLVHSCDYCTYLWMSHIHVHTRHQLTKTSTKTQTTTTTSEKKTAKKSPQVFSRSFNKDTFYDEIWATICCCCVSFIFRLDFCVNKNVFSIFMVYISRLSFEYIYTFYQHSSFTFCLFILCQFGICFYVYLTRKRQQMW